MFTETNPIDKLSKHKAMNAITTNIAEKCQKILFYASLFSFYPTENNISLLSRVFKPLPKRKWSPLFSPRFEISRLKS